MRRPLGAAAAAWLLLAGASHAQAPAAAPSARVAAAAAAAPDAFATDDPWERTNRRFFALDRVIDRRALRPAAVFYSHAVPSFIRARIRSALSNLGEPLVIINDTLQGRPRSAGRTFVRLAVNTTFGLAGLFDVAARQLPHHDNGFGITLGRWGVRTGPYVYLPVLGPSTVRGLVGSGMDIAANPFTWIRYPADQIVGPATTIAGGLDARARADGDLKALAALSTDEYATLRSFYLQNKAAQVNGGQVNLNDLPSFDDPAAGPVVAPAAPGSVGPTPRSLQAPEPALPGAPEGATGALPQPAPPPPAAPQAAREPAADEAPVATMARLAERAPRPVLLAALR
ncbi:MAG: VacJ family lipoprotein [Caulobacteraceae bacterium]|nr:VacJ family lipoprotein [Caulobacter sp.]